MSSFRQRSLLIDGFYAVIAGITGGKIIDRMDGKAGLVFGQNFADIDLVAPVEVDPPLVLAGRIHSIIVFRQVVDPHFQVVFLDVNIACGPVRVI